MSTQRTLTFLHTGDEHIDSDAHGSVNPDTGRNTAWESNYDVCRFLAEQAVERKVDAFITSGDEFKAGRPSAEALLMLAEAYTPLADAGIPILFLDGNHDRSGVSAGHRSALASLSEVLRGRGATVHASSRPELVEVGGIQVAVLPWLTPKSWPTNMNPADIDRKTAEHAHREMERLAGDAVSSMPLIMAGHVTVARPVPVGDEPTIRRGSERELSHLFSEPLLDVTKLEQLPFQYGALGHIHTPQGVGEKGIYQYAGSPNRLTFTDEPDAKGANLVTISTGGGAASFERVLTPARTLYTLDLDTDDRTGAIAGIPEGALVRVLLAPGDMELDRMYRTRIQAQGASIAQTKARPEQRPAPTHRPSIALTVHPKDALRTWAKDYAKTDVDALLVAAARLNGEAA